ncbi:hypothetical protein C8Q77DRAFT_1217970 [Trametes polyzona]|nr:hypothetical protein C8Q77DRAFT_1217970 [Trametes polyzona]
MAEMLPIDIWNNIFEFACTDGGRVASALSRVSRAFRSISTAYRYQSVRLSKLRDIEKFLASYERAHAASGGNAPRVRHLLLSFLPGETDVTMLEGAFHFRDYYSWREAKDEWNARCVDLLTRLFALAGAHLETLTVLQSRRIPLPFVHCKLPALRSLTLLADDRLFVRLPDEEDGDSDSWVEMSNSNFYATPGPLDLSSVAADPPFPALERLHIVDGQKQHTARKRLPWATTLPVWAQLAPRLAYLRLSGVDVQAVKSVLALVSEKPGPHLRLRKLTLQPVHDELLEGWGGADTSRVTGKLEIVDVRPEPGSDSVDWPRVLTKEWTEGMLL